MKKLLTVALALLMVFSLTGCSQPAPAAESDAPVQAEPAAPAQDAPSAPAAPEAAAAWVPEKEVEILCQASAGGGTDINIRTVAEIALKNGFTPVQWVVNYASTAAPSMLMSHDGESLYLFALPSAQVLELMLNDVGFTTADMTYLQIVCFDDLSICVTKDSPYQTIDELLEAAKAGALNYGGTKRTSFDAIACAMINKYCGTQFNFVQHEGSGEVMTDLLGGHVDVAIFNPAECLGQIEAGEIIPLVTLSTERIDNPLYAYVPTFGEVGYPEIVITEARGFAGPPNMPQEAIDFYDECIRQVCETDEWLNDYIAANSMSAVFMTAAEAHEFWTAQTTEWESLIDEMGLRE